ncbi:hypothetical protein HNR19_001900 [Nocardioides thalensis]|uniref:Uncharacterized protein n=1 Tax=Nocardioides thalensis TaxID=1914755 RepID=A0A853C3D5_9ACTN|nr:hypothetical protein [Nocardioides thalensis]NYJ01202.1 hypothetical protein [Nocardioides thalensis]
MSEQPAPRRRHLMDPSQPRKVADPEAIRRLETVQRRVLSALILTTVVHLTAGFILAAKLDVAGDRTDAQVVLVVIGALFWNVGVAAVLGINKRPLLSWWHLTSLLPLAAGIWWVCFA